MTPTTCSKRCFTSKGAAKRSIKGTRFAARLWVYWCNGCWAYHLACAEKSPVRTPKRSERRQSRQAIKRELQGAIG